MLASPPPQPDESLVRYAEGVAWCLRNDIPLDLLSPAEFGLPPHFATRAAEIAAEFIASRRPNAEPAAAAGPESHALPGNWCDPRAARPVAAVLATLPPPKPRWLSPGRLAVGRTTLLDAAPGLGASTLVADWAARISLGEPLPGGPPAQPRGVLFVAADDLANTVRPRLAAAGADLARIVALSAVDHHGQRRPPALPGDAALLARLAREVDAALIALDPLAAFLDPALDLRRGDDLQRASAYLHALAAATGAAVIAVRRLTPAVTRPRGDTVPATNPPFAAAMLLVRDPTDPAGRRLIVQRSGAPTPPLSFTLEPAPEHGAVRLAWREEAQPAPSDLPTAPAVSPSDEPSAVESAAAWLRSLLTCGPLPTRAVAVAAAEAGIADRTLDRARHRLGVVARRVDGRWLLHLPAAAGPAAENRPPKPDDGVGGVGALGALDREAPLPSPTKPPGW